MLETDYDVIVAGGGLTGTIAAQAISYYSKQNLRILSVDRNPETLPGRKGGAVGVAKGGLAAPVKKASSGAPAAEAAPAAATADAPAPAAEAAPAEKKE